MLAFKMLGRHQPTYLCNTLLPYWSDCTLCCYDQQLLQIPHTSTPLPSNRHHQSSGDCLEGKGENYQVCSVQYCVQQLCTVRYTHMNRLTVLWIGFCLTGPISLCLDSFLGHRLGDDLVDWN